MSKEGRIALGGLAAIFIWSFVVLPFYYGPRDDTAAQKCSAKEIENYSLWEKTRCDPVAYFTAWLVGFTGVLAASTIELWCVTRIAGIRQSGEMKESLRIAAEAAQASADAARATQQLATSERAWVVWVSADTGQLKDTHIDDKFIRSGLTSRVNFKNAGRSPAILLDIVCDQRVVSLEEEWPIFIGKREGKIGGAVVGPDQPFQSKMFLFDDEKASRVNQCKARLGIYVKITYRSIVSEQPVHTEVCISVQFHGGFIEDDKGRRPMFTIGPTGSQNTIT
jgi:hypothetical protein